jgi:hypothetical protein
MSLFRFFSDFKIESKMVWDNSLFIFISSFCSGYSILNLCTILSFLKNNIFYDILKVNFTKFKINFFIGISWLGDHLEFFNHFVFLSTSKKKIMMSKPSVSHSLKRFNKNKNNKKVFDKKLLTLEYVLRLI